MKRAGYLYERIAEPENLRWAFRKALRGKRMTPEVRRFCERPAEAIDALRTEILDRNVRIGDYRYFTIHDPKQRTICAASFRERVLHHAIINVTDPVFERYQIADSYACRRGLGVDAALRRTQHFCRRNPWYLKLDIRKYFDSIDHAVLMQLLERLFRDDALLNLFELLITSYDVSPGRGIPIGNLTSQYFANLYLGVLDHYAKETLRIHGYLRYMDDIVCFGDSRRTLDARRREIADFLQNRLMLDVREFTRNRTDHGLPFLKYSVRPERIRLTAESKRRFRRKCRIADAYPTEAERAVHIQPLLAHARRADTHALRRRMFGE